MGVFSGCKLFSWISAIMIVLLIVLTVLYFIFMAKDQTVGGIVGYLVVMGVNFAFWALAFKMYRDCGKRQDIIADKMGAKFRTPAAFDAELTKYKEKAGESKD
jgi:hypothetical protein